jgi:hypothetical protein
MRAAASANEAQHPLVAAFEAGRLLNQLDWHLQQAWLLPAINLHAAKQHAQEVAQCLTELTGHLCTVLPVPVRKGFLHFLTTQRHEWGTLLFSVAHRDSVNDAVVDIQQVLSQGGDVSPSRFREECWAKALRWVIGFAPYLYETVHVNLDDNGQRALLLGHWLDQGLHPREVYRLMCRPPSVAANPPQARISPLGCGTQNPPTTMLSQDTEAPAPLFPLTGEMIPDPGWSDVAGRMLREYELKEDDQSEAELILGPEILSSSEKLAEYLEAIRKGLAKKPVAMPRTGSCLIPPEERTRRMTYKEAAKLMRIPGTKPAETLSRDVKAGKIRCISYGPQQKCFSKSDFPPEAQSKLT